MIESCRSRGRLGVPSVTTASTSQLDRLGNRQVTFALHSESMRILATLVAGGRLSSSTTQHPHKPMRYYFGVEISIITHKWGEAVPPGHHRLSSCFVTSAPGRIASCQVAS